MEKVALEHKKINLLAELNKELKDPEFKSYIDKLNIPYEILAKYTTVLKECKDEYSHCKNCKSILECKNRIEGCMYIPKQNKDELQFCYQKCKYKKDLEEKFKYLKNVYTFNIPFAIKEANMKDIYNDDKNRFETIKYITKFIDNYLAKKPVKGLYLHGSFGCGKTYLISAMFNELAKHNIESAIIFWPDYLRTLKSLFNDNNEYKNIFEKVKTSPLLLIDDLGAENITEWSRDEILCPILQYRMENNLPTFITSNLNLEALEKHLSINNDVIKAKRIIERVEQLTNQIEMISKNLRK